MATKAVYSIPGAQNLDGLNLCTDAYHYLFKHRIDAFRLCKDEDILIATYPRTGTTWLSQIVTLMLASDEEYEKVKQTKLGKRCLYLEVSEDRVEPQIMKLSTIPPPRALKTHMPYRFINKWIEEDNVKAIITTRNPKDTLTSLFHFYKDHKNYDFADKSWDEFFEHVQAGLQEHGDQYEWLRDWANNKHKGQLLFLRYEDMKKDITTQIKKIIEFLDVEVSAERMEKISSDASFHEMKSSVAVPEWMREGAQFIRSGQIGGWRKYFTLEQNQWFDDKYKKLYEELPIDVYYE